MKVADIAYGPKFHTWLQPHTNNDYVPPSRFNTFEKIKFISTSVFIYIKSLFRSVFHTITGHTLHLSKSFDSEQMDEYKTRLETVNRLITEYNFMPVMDLESGVELLDQLRYYYPETELNEL